MPHNVCSVFLTSHVLTRLNTSYLVRITQSLGLAGVSSAKLWWLESHGQDQLHGYISIKLDSSGWEVPTGLSIMASVVILFLLVCLLASTIIFVWLRSLDDPTAPGPKGLLFSGNAAQLPKTQSWLTFAEWKTKYGTYYRCLNGAPSHVCWIACLGPIVHFRAYLRRFVVLNTAEAVNDLLEKRQMLYSDRPMSWMMFKLCGREMTVFNISSLHPRHRKYRRLMHNGLSSDAIESYWPLMQNETREMVEGFLLTPHLYEEYIRK